MNLAKKIGLKEDETVVKVVRQHGIFRTTVYGLALAVASVTSFFLFWLLEHGTVGMVIIVANAVLSLSLVVATWFKNYYNFLVLTNVRLVDVVRSGFWHELVSSVKYDNIKDIHVRRPGLGANLFNYGTIIIEIKSQKTLLELSKIHKPLQIQNLIEDCLENYQNRELLTDKANVYEAFIKLIPDLSLEELYEINDFVETRLVEINSESDGEK